MSLLRQLSDASDKKSPKSQTVQNVRNQLNEIRRKLGEDEYKKVIEQIKKEVTENWLQLLMSLFPGLFPNNPQVPDAPAVNPGGGGRGGGRVNPADFGPRTSVSNKPLTNGAQYYDYKPDTRNPGQKPGKGGEQGNIWSGFSQGPDGNCVTVSAIKAAMMQFGSKPTDVFKEVQQNGDGFNVTMRDGFKLYVSQNELQQAATHARFKGDDPAMITSANFMYAASAKRAQIENNDGVAGYSYFAAMNSLNDGEYSREGLDRLGLKNNYRIAQAKDFRDGMVGTVEYGGHSMAVIDNQIELWGRRGGRPGEGIMTVLFS